MNRQQTKNGRGIEWTDYTWNPVAGCQHGCRWQMPDGSVATCYAEDVANGVASRAYPDGFEAHYWRPGLLRDPLKLKDPAKIFVGSMADVFGVWVPNEQIGAILDVCCQAPQHIYQFLTKNAPRLLKFSPFPPNGWIGVSSPPDWMRGQRLNRAQQIRMLHRSLATLSRIEAGVTWMSFEPLSWDVAPIIAEYAGALDWAVIGAASNGKRKFQPDSGHVKRLLQVLDSQGVKIFFKGNLRGNPVINYWREEFPI